MSRFPIIPTLLGAVVLLILQRVVSSYIRSRKYKLPPCLPGTLPLLGNILSMPIGQQGKWARERAQKYGEMFTCKIGSKTWVFLNSSRVVSDLMEKRAAIYSSRPEMPMVSTIMSGESRIVLMQYNERWRVLRRVMHSILNKQNAPTFAPFQDLESKHLLYDFLHHPETWYLATQRFANSVIMSVVFGKRMEMDDPNVKMVFETSNDFLSAIQPGASPVDTFYWLNKLPKALQWWRPKGEHLFRKTLSVYEKEVNNLKERMDAGIARDCFATRFLKDPETERFGHVQTLFALGSLMEAGSDTSRMTISQIMCAAATDDRWVKTAVDLLDKICGANAERLPTFKDRPDLTYITAVVKEGFRWRPFAEIGFPTMLTQDDEYEGYKFPAGTVFTWNAFSIALDPNEFEDPERFWPERFMNQDVNNALKGHWSFGPGRRVCTGYNVGESNVWIAIARLLYCFKFEAIPDQAIDTMNINWGEYRWAPFGVKISVRSEAHRDLIEREGLMAVKTKY